MSLSVSQFMCYVSWSMQNHKSKAVYTDDADDSDFRRLKAFEMKYYKIFLVFNF